MWTNKNGMYQTGNSDVPILSCLKHKNIGIMITGKLLKVTLSIGKVVSVERYFVACLGVILFVYYLSFEEYLISSFLLK